jgi:hypothetical protein
MSDLTSQESLDLIATLLNKLQPPQPEDQPTGVSMLEYYGEFREWARTVHAFRDLLLKGGPVSSEERFLKMAGLQA